MRSSTSSFKAALLGIALLFPLFCTLSPGECAQPVLRVAVLPIHNLGNNAAPLREVRQELCRELRKAGVALVGDQTLEQVMYRHRLRYTGGIDEKTARFLREEAGAEAVLITSLELYLPGPPPKMALTSRIVSADTLEIGWMESVALSGDDSPGLLGLGMIEDPKELRQKALRRLVSSLSDHLAGRPSAASRGGKAFRAKTLFADDRLSGVRGSRVAVTPFYNLSQRYRAGEVLLLHVAKQLVASGGVRVIEPGVVREKMLEKRTIMDDGLSNLDLSIIGHPLKVDYFVTGRIFEYGDSGLLFGAPEDDFSASLFAMKEKSTVFASSSYNSGNDAVFFFDLGMVSTAAALADRMIAALAGCMLGRK